MKILSVFAIPIRIGGHFKSALAHIKCLREMGHDVWVMAPGGVPEMVGEFTAAGASVCDSWHGPPVRRLPSTQGADELIQLGARENVDLLHVQDPLALAPCFAAAIRLKAGLVLTAAGGALTETVPPRGVETVLFSKELLDNVMRAYPVRRDRLSIIRARIDTRVYRQMEVGDAFISKYNLPTTGRKVVMAVRVAETKRPWLDNLMRFAERVGNEQSGPQVVLAGEGPLLDEYEKRASGINRRCVGRARCHVIGPVFAIQELCQLHNYADVVVGHGRGILEAMACGKPAVILGEGGQGALVGPDNVEEIAHYNFSGRHFRHRHGSGEDLPALLRALITDERRLAEAGRFSHKYIRDHMAAETGAKQLLAVYEKALGRRHSRADFIRWYLTVAKVKAAQACRRRLGGRIARPARAGR